MAKHQIGRSAITGRYKSVASAKASPNTSIVETRKPTMTPKKPR